MCSDQVIVLTLRSTLPVLRTQGLLLVLDAKTWEGLLCLWVIVMTRLIVFEFLEHATRKQTLVIKASI